MNQLVFNFDIPAEAWGIAGAGLLCVLWACLAYAGMARRVARAVRRDTVDATYGPESYIDTENPEVKRAENCGQPVSVVVRAFNDGENLEKLLPVLLGQEYSPGFEIIVVNEGGSEETTDIVEALRVSFDNLYLTYTPDHGLNVSAKKLAVTLGVKAARHDIVVLTGADSVIDSPHWLSRMTLPFADPDTEVVLGYSVPDFRADRGMGRRTRAFNHTEAAVAWIDEAISGRPYRGTESNIAFRTKVFFDNKGFSSSLNLREGVDDIFVNEITRRDNTALELSRQSHVLTGLYDPKGQLRNYRRSHAFTGRFVPHRGAFKLNLGALSMLTAIGLLAWASVMAWPNAVIAVASAVLVLTMLIVTVWSWHKAFVALGSRRLRLTLPWLMLTRPLRAFVFGIKARMAPARNYTYSR